MVAFAGVTFNTGYGGGVAVGVGCTEPDVGVTMATTVGNDARLLEAVALCAVTGLEDATPAREVPFAEHN